MPRQPTRSCSPPTTPTSSRGSWSAATSSGSSTSSASATTTSSSALSSTSTRRSCSSWPTRRTTSRSRSTGCSSCSTTSRQASWRSRSSSGASRDDVEELERAGVDAVARHGRRRGARRRRRPRRLERPLRLARRSSRPPSSRLLGAVLALAAALRIVGAGSGLPLPLLNPDETNIVPRAWDARPRRRARPRLVRLSEPAVPRAGADADRARRAVLRRGPGRRRPHRGARGGGRVVARPRCIRAVGGCHGCGRRRRGDDPRRVLADGGHRRAAHARRHRDPRAARLGAPRVGRRGRRARSVGEVPRRGAGRAARRRRDRRVAARRRRAAGSPRRRSS